MTPENPTVHPAAAHGPAVGAAGAAGANRTPFSVYCTWGNHDELGDSVELTADMAHAALDKLEAWRKLGLAFDYFMLDCFWFDPAGGYLAFKKPHWPHGPEPLLERIAALGMKPGLWYSTNGWQLDTPAWASSKSTDWHVYSLVDGDYAQHLEAAFAHAIDTWGVRMLKLDFANFDVAAGRGGDSPRGRDETYRQGVRALKGILQRTRRRCPELRVIVHCGYARRDHGHGVHGQLLPGVDASWLEVVDGFFSGDPRPANVPQGSLPRASDLYQDQQAWRLWRDGLPLSRVEDHGLMVGSTSTCFFRQSRGIRRSHLGQLARGGRRDMFYGDPSLVSDADAMYMVQARGVYFDAYGRGLETAPVGPAEAATTEPTLCPWHGYLTGGGDRGLLYLVNSTWMPQQAELFLPGLFQAAALFHEGEPPAVQVQPDRLTVELAPEQATLLGLGEYATAPPLGSAGEATIGRLRRCTVGLRPVAEGLAADLPAVPGGRYIVAVRVVAGTGKDPLPGTPRTLAKQDNKQAPGDSCLHEDVTVRASTTDGRTVPPVERLPDRPVWSGISWTWSSFDAREPLQLQVSTRQPLRLLVDVWLQSVGVA